MGMRERRVGGVVYHTSPAGARTGGMGHFARSQQPSAVKTMVNESDWLALVNRLKHNLYNERVAASDAAQRVDVTTSPYSHTSNSIPQAPPPSKSVSPPKPAQWCTTNWDHLHQVLYPEVTTTTRPEAAPKAARGVHSARGGGRPYAESAAAAPPRPGSARPRAAARVSASASASIHCRTTGPSSVPCGAGSRATPSAPSPAAAAAVVADSSARGVMYVPQRTVPHSRTMPRTASARTTARTPSSSAEPSTSSSPLIAVPTQVMEFSRGGALQPHVMHNTQSLVPAADVAHTLIISTEPNDPPPNSASPPSSSSSPPPRPPQSSGSAEKRLSAWEAARASTALAATTAVAASASGSPCSGGGGRAPAHSRAATSSMNVARGAAPRRATSARAATSVARASAAATQSNRFRPGSAAAAVRADYSNVKDATVSVYGGGMRTLMQLRREAERAAPDRLVHTLPSQQRVRAQLYQQQQREAAAAAEEARVARAAQRRHQEYLRAQGLADVKPKVWETKEAKELPPRVRPKSAAAHLAATTTEASQPAALASSAPHPGVPSREVRSAANRAILRANQQLLDKVARERAAAEEAAAEAESKKKAKWSALRDAIMSKVEADRQQRKAMLADLEQADAHPLWMQVPNPPEPEPPAEVEDAEAAARDLAAQAQQRSMAAWRRQHGVAEGTPVFVVRDAYGVGVKTRLLQRGWAENPLEGAVTCNLLWTLRGQDVPFERLDDGVLVNHMPGAELMTTKSGLNQLVRSMRDGFDVCPRSYDPTVTSELLEFLEEYHWSAASALLQLLMHAGYPAAGEAAQATDDGRPTPGQMVLLTGVLNPTVLRWAVCACQTRLRQLRAESREDVHLIVNHAADTDTATGLPSHLVVWLGKRGEQQLSSMLVADGSGGGGDDDNDDGGGAEGGSSLDRKQWEQLLEVYEATVAYVASMGWRHDVAASRWVPGETAAAESLRRRVHPQLPWLLQAAAATLAALTAAQPRQGPLEGPLCAWMVKPAQAARGEGVKSVAGLSRVLEEATSGPHRILQKYMQAPLLVRGRKVDVRQWVLLTSAEPLQAWFFDESLIRFAGAAWSLEPEGITDVARHLCNHSLQCQLENYNTGDGLDGDQNMWGSQRMKQYLREEAGWGDDDVWERQVVPQMKRQTLALLTAARPTLTARAGCFELFGVDFLLDSQLGVWLLEVNESPDLRFTTPAKAAACGRMLDGLLSLVLRRECPLLQRAEFDAARFCTAETNSPNNADTGADDEADEGDASYDLPKPLTESSSRDAAAAPNADAGVDVVPAHNGWQLLTPVDGEEEASKRTRRPRTAGRVRPSSAAAVRPVRPKSAAPRGGGGGGALGGFGSRGLRQNCERLLAVVRSQGC